MTTSEDPLTRDALAIWHAGLRAVQGDNLVRQSLRIESEHLIVNDSEEYSLRGIERVLVLGAGKAAASMADGLENLWQDFAPKRLELTGWVNVPAECVSNPNSSRIHRHVARPFGINEPTLQACLGAGEIMRLARESTPRDLIICLISGGASALMPFPVDGVTLQDKLVVTRLLSRSGANIEELNTVRAVLSQIKGGGLARAGVNASNIITLVVSDILGDPVHLIGGGPTVPEPAADPLYAFELIKRFDANGVLPATIYKAIEQAIARSQHRANVHDLSRNRVFVLGNNATAVDAAGVEAVRLGYAYLMESSPRSEGDVKQVARRIALQWKLARLPGNPNCVISGGEPTVHVPNQSSAGIGGRNQHLALEVLSLLRQEEDSCLKGCLNMALVSGGTDGEDGPTRSAGAILNSFIVAKMEAAKLNHQDYLRRFDSYHFFEQLGGLLLTGPTGTNVCDLRVALAR